MSVVGLIIDHWLSSDSLQLRPQNSAARVFGAFAEGDQAQEHLARRLLLCRIEALVNLLRPLGQGPQDPAYLLVGGAGHQAVLAVVEELGHGVLQERQCAWLIDHIRDNDRHQAIFYRHTCSMPRFLNCPRQFVGRHRQHDLCVLFDPLAQGLDLQRPVVEVGAQGDYHAQRAVRRRYSRQQAVHEEGAPFLIFDQREQLFKLVDHQQQAGARVWSRITPRKELQTT